MLNYLRLKHNTGIEHENTPQKQPSMAEFVSDMLLLSTVFIKAFTQLI